MSFYPCRAPIACLAIFGAPESRFEQPRRSLSVAVNILYQNDRAVEHTKKLQME